MGSFFEDRYAKIDEKLMQEGAPVDFGGGFIVTVRHVSSEKVNLERGKITAKMRIGNRNKEMSFDQQKKVTSHIAAHAGIVTWEGGEAPTFSPALAEQIFAERPEFLEDVVTAMASYETFRSEEIDAAVGNLPAS